MPPIQAQLKHEGAMGGQPVFTNDRGEAAEHDTNGSISYVGSCAGSQVHMYDGCREGISISTSAMSRSQVICIEKGPIGGVLRGLIEAAVS